MSLESSIPALEVRSEQVAPYADQRCRTCWGRGHVVVDPPGANRSLRLCGCALQRFVRANLDKLDVRPDRGPCRATWDGPLRWRAGCAPAEAVTVASPRYAPPTPDPAATGSTQAAASAAASPRDAPPTAAGSPSRPIRIIDCAPGESCDEALERVGGRP